MYPPHPDDADYIVHACNAYPKLVELEAEKDEEIAWLRERVGLLDSLLGECLRHHYYDDARVSQSWLVESHKAVTSTGRALNQAALAPGGLTARKGK